MLEPAILRPALLPAVDRGSGASTIPLVTRRCGSTNLINGITLIPPGGSIPIHWHNCEESVMVIEGHAVAEIDGIRHILGPFDTTWIPADLPHRFLNETEAVLRIFWTYADIAATRTMQASGETRSIDAEHGQSPQ